MANEYATWNPLDKDPGITLSNGDLTATPTASWRGVRATKNKSAGKWYFEITINTAGYSSYGVATADHVLSTGIWGVGRDSYGWGVQADGNKYHDGYVGGVGVSWANGDVMMIAVDMTAGKIWVGKNGSWVGDPAAGTGEMFSGLSGALFPMYAATNSGSASCTANFGASALAYSAPSGFSAGWYDEAPTEIVADPLAVQARLAGTPVMLWSAEPLSVQATLAAANVAVARFISAEPLSVQASLGASLRRIVTADPLAARAALDCFVVFPPEVISAAPLAVRAALAGRPAILWSVPALAARPSLAAADVVTFTDRDYIVRWRCYLSPFRGALAGGLWVPGSDLPDLALPMGSFQLRHTWDREEAGVAYWNSYLSAVIPGAELADDIAARAVPVDLGDGTYGRAKLRIVMVKAYRSGHEAAETIAEGELSEVRLDEGPISQSISVAAYAAASGSPKTIRLTDPQYHATYGGQKRYRVAPNLFFRCGDTALIGSDSLLAQDVTMYVGVEAGAVMEVSGT